MLAYLASRELVNGRVSMFRVGVGFESFNNILMFENEGSKRALTYYKAKVPPSPSSSAARTIVEISNCLLRNSGNFSLASLPRPSFDSNSPS